MDLIIIGVIFVLLCVFIMKIVFVVLSEVGGKISFKEFIF